jgi:hypothetical protein
MNNLNFLMITYDSCRYDSVVKAETPILDKYSDVYCAYTPATYTYASMHSFFSGMLPVVPHPIPYYNRLKKPLFAFDEWWSGMEGNGTIFLDKEASI